MVLLDPEAPEERRAQLIEQIRGQIQSGESSLKGDADWGMRRLAYEIDHRTEAQYHLFQFEAAPDVLASLDRSLSIEDAVLRFRTIRLPGDAPEQTPQAPPQSSFESGRREGRRDDRGERRPEPAAEGDTAEPPAEGDRAEPPAEGDRAEPPAEGGTAEAAAGDQTGEPGAEAAPIPAEGAEEAPVADAAAEPPQGEEPTPAA
jgi:small subunit ribosomal protein S6